MSTFKLWMPLAFLAIVSVALTSQAQKPPTAYTITESSPGSPTPLPMMIYRNGDKAVMELTQAPLDGSSLQRHAFSFYDLPKGTVYSWSVDKPGAKPDCSVGSFSGNWGDPFVTDSEISKGIADGSFRPAGTETVGGVATKIYSSATPQGNVKIWLDEKDGLVMRVQVSDAGGSGAQTLVDIKKLSLGPPPASVFELPASCAGLKKAPTAEEVIATETGDSAANYTDATHGPGSANSCSVVLRVVNSITMTPTTRGFQVAIDPTYKIENPPHYEFGVRENGSQTYSGGGVKEITSQIHDGMVRIDNPPAYFNLSVNIYEPHHGAGMGLIYRQCYAPQTVLLYVIKDQQKPWDGGDFLWVKSGKYATVPAAH